MTIQELKAKGFDIIGEISRRQSEIQRLNQMLAQLQDEMKKLEESEKPQKIEEKKSE